ncbi:MAG: CHAT domain-containing protein, partial [Symploca sp. SIO1A3]|nr:CHAT domain-containing protein [Symploca sp. SIO1A3]
YQRAIDFYQQSLILTREREDAWGESDSLIGLGKIFLNLGEYERAIDYYQASLAVAQKIGYRRGESDSLIGLGNVYIQLREYEKAIDFHQQSLNIARAIGNYQQEVNSLIKQGNAYLSLGEYAQAFALLQESLKLARSIDYPQGESNALMALGNIYFSLGNYKAAIEHYQPSLSLARIVGSRQQEGAALGSLANAYNKLRDYQQAVSFYNQSLAIAQEIQDRTAESNTLTGLGNAYWSLGEYEKAIEYHTSSLNLAYLIGSRRAEGISLGNLGLAYWSLGDYNQAIEYHQRHLQIAQEIGDRQGKIASSNNLGLALRDSGKLAEAETILRRVIEDHEQIRGLLDQDSWKITLLEEQIRTYRLLQQVLVTQEKPFEALEIAERGRTRALIELLLKSLSPDQQESAIADYPKLAEIKQIAVQQKATLVEYSLVSESLLYIWVIRPKDKKIEFRSVDIPQNTPISELVTASRRFISARSSNENNPTSDTTTEPSHRLQQLHQLLIEPIADLLPNKTNERVLFIPHKELFLVPFAALQDANYNYLIEKHTILTAPSIQSLALTRQHRQRVQNLEGEALVAGNPTMPELVLGPNLSRLDSLQGAEREAEQVAAILNTKALIGSQATETAIVQRMQNAKIIHLATHGLLDDINGVGSPGAIVLAASAQDDGFLTSSEIMEQYGLPNTTPLQAELVVLSACDTGRGEIKGEGVIGLSRSLIAAGVPSLVVSLWKVPDHATQELMVEFYTNLYEGKLDKAQALRQAMLTMLDEGENPDPQDWAAFTVIGEAE